MTPVLSIENALNWSWGLAGADLMRLLKYRYRFVRITRRPGIEIAPGLLDYFPVTLCQNIDNMSLLRKHKGKVACRMGGMVIDKKSPGTRYNREIAQAGAVIATNSQLYEIAAEVNGRTFLVPNGVDTEYFRPREGPQEGARDDMRFTVGFAGNIIGIGGNYKGWQQYVEACLMLELDGGFGHIECLHGAVGHQSQIPHERMREDFYWKIDALILPSKGEGCSNVTGEAMACGVPVLTTKVGYHGERLTDGENVLFIERDPADIAEKVRMLRDDQGLRKKLGQNGRRFVCEHQDIRQVAREYDRIFQLVLKQET